MDIKLTSSKNENLPLCVDLDGTLVRTDLLFESMLALLKRNPLYLFMLLLWLMRGRAYLKRRVAQRAEVDVSTLPWDTRVLELLRLERSRRSVVLCTASDQILADAVARHLGCFDKVMASDGSYNLSGRRKAAALVGAYGERGFDYAGNEARDLAIWQHARNAHVVNADSGLAARVSRISQVASVLPRKRVGVRIWLKALRVHQWAKNVLIFLPLLAAHEVLRAVPLAHAIAAFVIFGICASSVYMLNDLLDLHADRAHPRKCERPFAAGCLSLSTGLVVAPILTIIAFAAAYALDPRFALVLFGYYVLTFAYSLRLKQIAMLDVLVLAGLYTVRIFAGAAATDITPSFWMLAFSMFLFLSLAILKRYTELIDKRQAAPVVASGRGYHVDDLSILASLGTGSGLLSVLVLALYIQGEGSMTMYHRPQFLWLLCPLLLYWLLRAWLIAHRGAMHDDPVIFAVTDWVSRIVIVLGAGVALAAL